MKARIWGCRGSLPSPLTTAAAARKAEALLAWAAVHPGAALAEAPFHLRATYGGNSSCVELETGGGASLLLDAGTGLRQYGLSLGYHAARPREHHLLLSHTHWDHIQGLPFFEPIYRDGDAVHIYGCHPGLEERLSVQFDTAHFPVRWERLAARLSFTQLKPGAGVEIAGAIVTPYPQRHPGASYAYRVESGGRSVVYSTDSEHGGLHDHRTQAFIAFCRDTDLLIFDAMYTYLEANTDKADWGHSSNITGVEIAKRAAARRLCLFHHDPDADDARLDETLEDSRRYADHYRGDVPLEVVMAYEGLEIAV